MKLTNGSSAKADAHEVRHDLTLEAFDKAFADTWRATNHKLATVPVVRWTRAGRWTRDGLFLVNGANQIIYKHPDAPEHPLVGAYMNPYHQ